MADISAFAYPFSKGSRKLKSGKEGMKYIHMLKQILLYVYQLYNCTDYFIGHFL